MLPARRILVTGVIATLALSVASHSRATQPVYFSAPSLVFPTSSPVWNSVTGDFDEDGTIDVVAACVSPDHLAFLKGDGTGQLGAEVATPTTAQASDMAVADMDGDTHLDILIAGSTTGQVLVHLGNGDGTFAAPTAVAVGGSVTRLALGNLDGSGSPDVVALATGPVRVITLVGQPNGSLLLAQSVAVGQNAYDVALADLDSDLIADVAVAGSGPNAIVWWKGVGNGTLGAATSIALAQFNNWLELADLNADGRVDLIYGQSTVGIGTQLATRLGNGDGTFGAQTLTGNFYGSYAPVVQDVNHDNFVDVVQVCNTVFSDFATSLHKVGVALGNGSGAFTPVDSYAGAVEGRAQLADMDEDGTLDLVAGSLVALGRGDGGFGLSTDLPAPRNLGVVGIADLNHDLSPDLTALGGNCEFFGNAALDVRLGSPAGIPGAATTTTSGLYRCANDVAYGDYNNDGNTDIAFSTQVQSGIQVQHGDGTGALGAATSLATTGTLLGVLATDLNGDTRPDLVSVGTSSQVAVFLGLPGGGLAPRTEYPIPGFPWLNDVVAANVTGDSSPDLVVVGDESPGQLWVLPGLGGGAFGAAVSYATNDIPLGVALGDWNEDGRLDAAIASDPPCLLLGQAGGTFGGLTTLPALPEGASDLAGFDADMDGNLDLAILQTNRISLLLGAGNGTFSYNLGYSIGGPASTFAAGDLNGDGLTDLLSANTGPSSITRLMGRASSSGVPGDGARFAGHLLAVAPNPMRTGTTVVFTLSRRMPKVTLGLFDVTGRRVRRWDTGELGVGRHELQWDGRMESGAPAPAGAYFVRLLDPVGSKGLKLVRLPR